MIDLENFQYYNYYELCEISDVTLKSYLLSRYLENMKCLFESIKENIDYELSLDNAYNYVEEKLFNITSEILFPGNVIDFYPIIKESKASKEHRCDFSNAKINKGSNYIRYKVCLYNRNKKAFYVTNVLKLEHHLTYRLPMDLHEFEIFLSNLEKSYEKSLELYDLYGNINGNFALIRLKSKKNTKNS